MWFGVEEADLGFCDRSRHRFENSAVLKCDAIRAFEVIASGPELSSWLEDCKGCRWTSDEPHGVGSTRDVSLKMMTVRERFVAWDPGTRLAFTVRATSIPLVAMMLEDLRIEALGPDESRVTWVVHYEPRGVVRPIHGLVRSVFGGLLSRSAKNLERYVADRSAT